MDFILKIWFIPNEFLLLSYQLVIQSRMFRKISDSNSFWMVRYCNFCDDNFVVFSISYLFYYYETSDLRQKSCLQSKKPNDAVEFFTLIGSQEHLEGSHGNISLKAVDL